eukprot:1255483-Rhodomonas_salina.2
MRTKTTIIASPHAPAAPQLSSIATEAFIVRCAIPSSRPSDAGYTIPMMRSRKAGGGRGSCCWLTPISSSDADEISNTSLAAGAGSGCGKITAGSARGW